MNQLDSFLSLRKGNKLTIFWFWLTSFAPFLFIYLHIFAILWTCEENVSVWLISNLLICCFHFYSSPNGTGSFCRQFCFVWQYTSVLRSYFGIKSLENVCTSIPDTPFPYSRHSVSWPLTPTKSLSLEVFLESDDNWNFRHFFFAKNGFYILCIYGLYPKKNFGVL